MEATIERPGQPTIPGLMTEAEARDTVRRIRECCESAGALILDLRDREGWRALGYGSWRECAAQELGVSVSRVYQLAAHAEISTMVEKAGLPAPNERQARELAALPAGELIPAWSEALASTDGNPTARDVATAAAPYRPAGNGSLLDRKQDATRATSDERDDFQTPDWALDVILPYLDPAWVIWECAAGKGNLVRGFRERGFRCDSSDIRSGADFLKADHPHPYDCIITNPPFSRKDDFLRRCYALGKPFALLMPAGALFEKARMALYRECGIRVVAPDRRINFETPNGRLEADSSAWFFSAWFTWGLSIPAAPCDVTFWMPGTTRESGNGQEIRSAESGMGRPSGMVGDVYGRPRVDPGSGSADPGGESRPDFRVAASTRGDADGGGGEPDSLGKGRLPGLPVLDLLAHPEGIRPGDTVTWKNRSNRERTGTVTETDSEGARCDVGGYTLFVAWETPGLRRVGE